MKGKKLLFVAVLLCLGMRCESRCTAGECPLQGWVKFFDHSCLKIYSTLKRNWAQAEAICRVIGMGSHLVQINSDVENSAIADELKLLDLKQGTYFWIGLNDIEMELNRTWVGHQYEENMLDLTDFQEFNTAYPFENCGTILNTAPLNWNLMDCQDKYGFICQQPLAQ